MLKLKLYIETRGTKFGIHNAIGCVGYNGNKKDFEFFGRLSDSNVSDNYKLYVDSLSLLKALYKNIEKYINDEINIITNNPISAGYIFIRLSQTNTLSDINIKDIKQDNITKENINKDEVKDEVKKEDTKSSTKTKTTVAGKTNTSKTTTSKTATTSKSKTTKTTETNTNKKDK